MYNTYIQVKHICVYMYLPLFFLIMLVHPPDEQLGFFRLHIQLPHLRMRVLLTPYIQHDRCQSVQARVRTLDAQHRTPRRQHIQLLLLLETCRPHEPQDFHYHENCAPDGTIAGARAKLDENGWRWAKTGGNTW